MNNLDEETQALLERVQRGNEKLIQAWPKIIKIPGHEEFLQKVTDYNVALQKLRQLAELLKARGYNICLYAVNGVKPRGCYDWPDSQLCRVCPSDKQWPVIELFGEDSPLKRRVDTGPNWTEFCKTLGGKI
jgi:hypothetical protein